MGGRAGRRNTGANTVSQNSHTLRERASQCMGKKSRIHSKKEKMPPLFENVSDSKQASKLTKFREQYVPFNGM